MRGNISMNTSSLARKGRALLASKVKKKRSNFRTINVRFTVVPSYCSPVNTNQAWLKWPSIRNVHEKAKEKGGKEREKGGKMEHQIAKEKNLHAHTFSHRDPAL